jgi:hypothetical protein
MKYSYIMWDGQKASCSVKEFNVFQAQEETRKKRDPNLKNDPIDSVGLLLGKIYKKNNPNASVIVIDWSLID